MTRRHAVPLALLLGLVLGVVGSVGPPGAAAAGLGTKVAKALKLAKRADKKAEAALAASGQPGPQGPQGPQGIQGPRGPSAAQVSSSNVSVTWTGAEQTLASIPVVSGRSYVVDSHVVANNNDGVSHDVSCALSWLGTSMAAANTIELGANLVDDRDVISLSGAMTASSDGAVELRCTAPTVMGNWLDHSLSTIEVATLN